jgi:hypothetical protein
MGSRDDSKASGFETVINLSISLINNAELNL